MKFLIHEASDPMHAIKMCVCGFNIKNMGSVQVLDAWLSKLGSYVGSQEVGRIVNRRIGSWIVRSYLFSDLKQKTH